jgi:predicted Zn-dependent protease with MMP-like domain
MGVDSLLGVYVGVPLTERHPDDLFRMPDQIIVFQRPIEAACRSEREIVEQIRVTIVHEVGHFFGLSDDEIEAVLGP